MNVIAAILNRMPFWRRYWPSRALVARVKSRHKTVLYAFHCGAARDNPRLQRYKVGKTVDLERRIRPYRTIYPQGRVFHSVDCADIDVAERWLHDVLKLSGYHVEKEIFEAPPDVLKATMDAVAGLHQFWSRNGKKTAKIRCLQAAAH
jgi:hypothetical protein